MSVFVEQNYFGHGGSSPYAQSLRAGGTLTLYSIDDAAPPIPIDAERFTAPADAADSMALQRAAGPVLDVGCGPGRMVRAAISSGLFALGIDVSPDAVSMAHASGIPVLHHDVNDPLPLEGLWGTVLLIDGNIGIGGDPAGLLLRSRQLVQPQGRIIVEVSTHPEDDRVFRAEVRDCFGRASDAFPWAVLGEKPLGRIASGLGLRVAESWSADDRRFALLSAADAGLSPLR